MSSYENHQALDGLTLGKSTDYRDNYDASLLQGVPRSLNRDPLGLTADNLPFHGADIWTLYELSWLNSQGLPQVAVGHVELDYTSVNLIESKSFKLYLPHSCLLYSVFQSLVGEALSIFGYSVSYI